MIIDFNVYDNFSSYGIPLFIVTVSLKSAPTRLFTRVGADFLLYVREPDERLRYCNCVANGVEGVGYVRAAIGCYHATVAHLDTAVPDACWLRGN